MRITQISLQRLTLPLDDMVSHFIELDQIPEAFERLRHGEGGRSVIVVDPELAGVPDTQDRTTHFDRQ